MLSTEERRRLETRGKNRRSRNLEGVVRATHASMAGAEIEVSALVEGFSDRASAGNPQSWLEMVFEGRNKEYGAYTLRKSYNRSLYAAMAITVAIALFLVFYPALAAIFGNDAMEDKKAPRKVVYSELSLPPSIDKPKPLPPQIQIPRLQKVVKFLPPKVVKEEVTVPPPSIEEIRVTGAEDQEGPAEVIFQEPVEEVVVEDNELFTVVDQQPEFDGGYAAMMAFITQNMKYPTNARRMQIEGTVHVSFIVSKNGAISDVKVLRGIMTECDREAVRVVQLMPPWKPGKQNGRSVNVRFILPLKFKLN